MASPQAHKTSDDRPKKERLEARISADEKTLLLKAARITGRSLTDFVVATLHETAIRTVREHESMNLNIIDSTAFVRALLNPPAPERELRKAVRRYKQRVAE